MPAGDWLTARQLLTDTNYSCSQNGPLITDQEWLGNGFLCLRHSCHSFVCGTRTFQGSADTHCVRGALLPLFPFSFISWAQFSSRAQIRGNICSVFFAGSTRGKVQL